MKALLRHDWYRYRKSLLLFFGIYGGIMGLIFVGESYPIDFRFESEWLYKMIFLLLLLPVDLFVGLMPAKALSDSLKSGWLRLSVCFPYTRKQVMMEKIVFGLLIIAVHGLCVTMCQVTAIAGNADGMAVIGQIICWELTKPLIISALVMLFTVLLNLSAAICILIGTGIVVPHLLVGLLEMLCRDSATANEILRSVLYFLTSYIGGFVVLGIAAVLYIVCGYLSVKAFRHKEL